MDYRSRRDLPTKLDRAELLLTGLASLLGRGGERLALLDGNRAPNTWARGAFTPSWTDCGTSAVCTFIGRRRPCRTPCHHGAVRRLPGSGRGDHHRSEPDCAFRPASATQLVQILDPTEVNLSFNGRVRFREMAEDLPIRQTMRWCPGSKPSAPPISRPFNAPAGRTERVGPPDMAGSLCVGSP